MSSYAWQLSVSRDISFLVASHHISELLRAPQWIDIPGACSYCRRLLLRDSQLIPILEFSSEQAYSRQPLVLLLTYKGKQGERWGAIRLTHYPQMVSISDSMVGDMKQLSPIIRDYSIAAVCMEERHYGIVNVAQLFSPRPVVLSPSGLQLLASRSRA
ncbi:hypothetical protein [Pleionea sp. CnH1-48]|uniref:hypothetical protein n=1 Tax=Pleionea sp. CnH1-48 TaxID=2954494 RepID=UPI0020971602|nr:hypothetical protein [Pleionea sp. CnH1-48]MCO7223463.1 hypothetical protein [Pleionea sp. CnH1-48]